ncbi:actinia tenebrosa protease inhibitors-like isoform X2 [Maniola jurtina]|uniref:actinia tenebrosa protease inhibitors-like isoform X2 n=1 Tax=Maniola jurtina TaxID=191418 RepID=UPI001E689E8A|nr:actinia tenebrosa protease inhibitors-like isoform X2 [Maniola jurtina]
MYTRKMHKRFSIYLVQLTILITFLLLPVIENRKRRQRYKFHTSPNERLCIRADQTLRDTGPCRADIIQWYYDVRQARCYRFFWGGCQGNGNKFESRKACRQYCRLNITYAQTRIPFFCSLSFEYGTCFGYFNRWTWDTLTKTCRQKLYSGCGGNQNNFQSQAECLATCMNAPNNTLQKSQQFTTCIPLPIPDIH